MENLVVIFLLTVLGACHRVSKTTDTVIVTLSKRKVCQDIWSIKNVLQRLTMEDLKLPGSNKLFINRSLCPYYKMLWCKNKKLHSLSEIFSLFISGDMIKIKVNENSSPLSITHFNHTSVNILLMFICHHRHA